MTGTAEDISATRSYINMITLEHIPEDRLILISEKDVEYAFDIAQLAQLYEVNRKKAMRNPYTNEYITDDVYHKVREYSENHRIIIDVTVGNSKKFNRSYYNETTLIGELFISVCGEYLPKIEDALLHTLYIEIGNGELSLLKMPLKSTLSKLEMKHLNLRLVRKDLQIDECERLGVFLNVFQQGTELYDSFLIQKSRKIHSCKRHHMYNGSYDKIHNNVMKIYHCTFVSLIVITLTIICINWI